MNNTSSNAFPIEINAAEVNSMLNQNAEFLLLDCREPDEYQTARITGSVLIPMNQTLDRIGEIQPYHDQPIIVYCHGGVRSLRVANYLRANGFSKTQSMAGGIDAWSLQIDDSVPRY